jgi:hypothetical protein
MEDAVRSGIVGFEWCARLGLWVTQLLEGRSDGHRILRVEEKASDFCFSG